MKRAEPLPLWRFLPNKHASASLALRAILEHVAGATTTITIETCVTTVNVGNEFSRLIRRNDRDDRNDNYIGSPCAARQRSGEGREAGEAVLMRGFHFGS